MLIVVSLDLLVVMLVLVVDVSDLRIRIVGTMATPLRAYFGPKARLRVSSTLFLSLFDRHPADSL